MSLEVRGYIDALQKGKLIGWCERQGDDKKVDCELVINEQVHVVKTANLYRSDLRAAAIGDGCHGFEFDLNSLNLDFITKNELEPTSMSVRACGTDGKFRCSSFVPFFSAQDSKHRGLYLARFLTEKQKIDCLNSCNSFLFERMVSGNLNVPVLLWQKKFDQEIVSLVLKHSDFAPFEGELAVNLLLNNETVYSLTFSIVSGAIFDCEEPLILFIGGLQGRKNSREKVEQIVKLNEDIHPRMLTFMAILAICQAWGIDKILAVSASQQLSCDTPEQLDRFALSYDHFWKSRGGVSESPENNFYLISADSKPGFKKNNKHQQRQQKRRLLRNRIYDDILLRFIKPAPSENSYSAGSPVIS